MDFKCTTLAAFVILYAAGACYGQITLDKKELIKFVKEYKFPEVSKSGGTSYRVNRIEVQSFKLDGISVKPGTNSITVSVDNVRGRVQGKYWARVKKWFFSASSSGNVHADFSNVGITATASINQSSGKISVTKCDDRIGSFKVRTSGSGWSWLINFVVRFFDGKIKNKVESVMCPSLIKLINSQSDKILEQLG